MSYMSLQPFREDRKEFERYTALEDKEGLVYNRYLKYDEKMNQVVARIFRLDVLQEDGKTQDKIVWYRRNYGAPFNHLNDETRVSVLERALSEEKLKALPAEEREEERLRLDYILFHSQHEVRDDLKEYTTNTMMVFRPHWNAGNLQLTRAFEQAPLRDKVETVVACYQKMVQRIKEVKGW